MKNTVHIPVVAALIGLSLLARIALFPYVNEDLVKYVLPWFDFLVEHGGFQALKYPFYNYSPPYLYFLAAVSYLHPFFGSVELIKTISIGFDFAAAWALFRIIRLFHPQGNSAYVALLGAFFAPTVIIDSAYWGQCDGIYTSFLLFSLYDFCTGKNRLGLACFASAFAFKAQAVFLAPLILILLLKRRFPWKDWIILPVGYFIWMIPYFLAGGRLDFVFSVYFQQADLYPYLTMVAPNLYVFISNDWYAVVYPIGLLVSALVAAAIVLIAAANKMELKSDQIVLISVVSATLLPFFLPKMHERYFYPAALIAICLPFVIPRLRLVPLALQTTSLLSYTYFLRGTEILPLEIPAVINGILVVVLAVTYAKSMTRSTGLLHTVPARLTTESIE